MQELFRIKISMAGPGMSVARDREGEQEGDSLGSTVWDYENTLAFNSYTGKYPTAHLEAWRWDTQIKPHSL